jgi:hypothetical protein
MKLSHVFWIDRAALAAFGLGFAFSLLACNRSRPADLDRDQEPAKTAPLKPSVASNKPAAPVDDKLSLEKLGLKTIAPHGSTAGPAIIGDGVMIQGPDLVVTVEESKKNRPKTLKDAQKEAAVYTPQNTKAETLSDGFALTFQNSGSAGANYFVHVRRELGKKAYWCETTASTPAQQQNALRACKSLEL